MITCNKCNAKNEDYAIFCNMCGQKIELEPTQQCTACGNIFKATAKFCNKCGTPSVNFASSVNNYSKPEIQPAFVPLAEPVSESVSDAEDPFSAFRDPVANQPVEATELLVEDVPAPVVPRGKTSPFAAFKTVSEPVAEPVVEPEPIVEPVIEAAPIEATEILTEVVAEPEPVIEPAPIEATEILTEVVAEPEVIAEPEPIVEPEPIAQPVDATELLTDVVSETVVPETDPLSNYDIVQPEDPFASVNSYAASAEQATEILTDDVPAYNPPVPLQTNGEDYSYAQPDNYQYDASLYNVQDSESEGGKKDKKKKKAPIGLIIFLIILALLAGGGIFAYTQGWLDTPIEKVKGVFGKDDATSESDEADEEDKLSLNDVKLPDIPDQSYTGSEIIPSFSIAIGDTKLKEGEDYTIECVDNITVGTATLVITGKGDIEGTVSGTFKIIYGNPLLDDPNNAPMVNYVTGLYTNIYGRRPTGTELANDCKNIRTPGFDLESYLIGFVNSSEFDTMCSNLEIPEGSSLNEQLVSRCLYNAYLGSSADAAGLASWTGAADESGFEACIQSIVNDAGINANIRATLGIQ